RLPPPSTPFPYTTLFRSHHAECQRRGEPVQPGHVQWVSWPRSRAGDRRTDSVTKRRDGPEACVRVLGERSCDRVGYPRWRVRPRSEEHTSELQSRFDLVC